MPKLKVDDQEICDLSDIEARCFTNAVSREGVRAVISSFNYNEVPSDGLFGQRAECTVGIIAEWPLQPDPVPAVEE